MTDPTIIFETFLAPTWYKPYQYITEYVERYVNVPTFLLNGEALEDFAAGYADAGFISTASSLQLLDQTPCSIELIAAPLMQDEEIGPAYFHIVVRKESSMLTASDLAGCTWAAQTCMVRRADDEAAMPVLAIADTIETTTQAQSLRLVLDGTVDATIVDERTMDLVLHNSPAIAAQLRVLTTYCASRGPFVVVATHVKPPLKQRLREALLTIHKHPFYSQQLQESSIRCFLPISNQFYQREHMTSWEMQTPTHLTPSIPALAVSEYRI